MNYFVKIQNTTWGGSRMLYDGRSGQMAERILRATIHTIFVMEGSGELMFHTSERSGRYLYNLGDFIE